MRTPIHARTVLSLLVLFSANGVIRDSRAGETEVIELRQGQKITGEVVSEKRDAIFVDVGYDILKIPADQIVKRSKPSANAPKDGANPEANAGQEENGAGGFYSTKRQERMTVKELVDKFGEAVVSIETPSGKGSGFIINPEGYALTNCHVIEGETQIAAILYLNAPGGLSRKRIDDVEIIALNPFVDLALIKLPPQKNLKLTHVPLGNINEVRAGDGVFAVGNPLGLERSVTQGIISTRSRNFRGQIYLQTDTAINPGNSGGPLFNMRGEVVGVTNMKASFGDNVGFAIPVNQVKDFLDNRETFVYGKDNPNTGHRYVSPPRRQRPGAPPGIQSPPAPNTSPKTQP